MHPPAPHDEVTRLHLSAQHALYATAGLVLIALLATLRISTAQLAPLPSEPLRDAVSLSTAILIESFPFIMLGILLSIVVRIWMPQHLFWRFIPSRGVLRRLVMSFIGTFLPVCECGNVPLARALIRQGLNQGDVLAFTLSAPLLNPVTIVTTYQAFGSGSVLWGRILGGFVIAQVIAWFATWRTRQPASLLYGSATSADLQSAGCDCLTERDDRRKRSQRMRESLRIFQTETAVLMPPLIFGALVAGLIQVGVSREILLAVGSDPVLSVLAMIALAFVVSICSSVDAFFALSLVAVFTPGALLAFLIFGAMVDIKMLMLLRTTFAPAVLVRMVVGLLVLCVLLGVGVNVGGIGA